MSTYCVQVPYPTLSGLSVRTVAGTLPNVLVLVPLQPSALPKTSSIEMRHLCILVLLVQFSCLSSTFRSRCIQYRAFVSSAMQLVHNLVRRTAKRVARNPSPLCSGQGGRSG